MTRPVILLDADGVLCDLVTPLVEEANALVNKTMFKAMGEILPDADTRLLIGSKPIRPDDVTEYDIAKAFPGLTPAQVYAPLYRQGFCRSLKPYHGAVEAVRRLQELGEVYCVTKPTKSPYWKNEREEWLQAVVGIPEDHVIFCHDKGMIRGDVLVDDNPEFVEAWWNAGLMDDTEKNPFLWDRPYNRKSTFGWMRVSTWDRIIECVEDMT